MAFMHAHPHIAVFVGTWLSPALMILGFLALLTERKLRLPNILARCTETKMLSNLNTNPLQNSEGRTQSNKKLDWHWLVQIQLANQSDTSATIEAVKAQVKIGKRTVESEHYEATDELKSEANMNLPSLWNKIRGVPLVKGAGHRGWLCFNIKQVSEQELGRLKMKIWFIDALGSKHKVRC